MKINGLILTFFFLSIAILPAFSAEKNEIDIFLEKCMEKDYTTMGMVNCEDQAYKKWDIEINKYYQLLIKQLSKNEKKNLVNSQLNWIKFRDSEFINIDTVYSKMQGTMYIPMNVDAKNEIVKQRTLQLKNYYLMITNQEEK